MMKRILAFDYGTHHIGVSFTESKIGEPLSPLINNSRLLENIKLLVERYNPEELVVGLPHGPLHKPVRVFASSLSIFRLPVHLHPETLSTQEALQKLKAAGASRAKLRSEHSYAATLILEDYLV